jgi:hypothetical protein
MSALAEGADRIVTRVFLETRQRLINDGALGIDAWELIVTFPFAEQAYRDDFPNSVDEFEQLLSAASGVVTISHAKVGQIRSDQGKRDEGYEAQGHYMLRHSNLVIALWDGVHLDLKGGTSHVVRLKIRGHENPGNPFSVHDCGPIWHVPVERGGAGSKVHIGEARYIFPDHGLCSGIQLEQLKGDLSRFNTTWARTGDVAAARKTRQYLAPAGEEGETLLRKWLSDASSHDRQILALYCMADVMAVRHDQQRTRLIRCLYATGFVLALSLWTGLDKIAQVWMVGAYLAALIVVIGLFARLTRRDLSKDQLDYRLFAEALRVQLYLRMLDEKPNDANDISDDDDGRMFGSTVLDALLTQHAMEIGWIREALRLCGWVKKPTHLAIGDRALLVRHWVNDQLAYFARSELKYDNAHRRIRRLAVLCAIGGVVAAASAVWIDQNGLSEDLRHGASIAAAMFPAMALLLESYKDRMAIEEQAKNYARMRAVFGRFADRFHTATPDKMPSAGLVRSLAQEALSESVNWLILRRSKPPVLPT